MGAFGEIEAEELHDINYKMFAKIIVSVLKAHCQVSIIVCPVQGFRSDYI